MSDSKSRTKAGLVGRPLLAGALAAAGASASLPACADVFMFIEGIRGESNESKHKDWIEILSYTQTFRNTPSTGGGGAGKVSCGDITVLKSIDQSSVEVIGGVVTGKLYKEAKIEFTTASAKGQLTYYKVAVQDVQLISIEQTDQPDDARIVERVTLRGSRFDYSYSAQEADGKVSSPVEFSVDCRSFKF